MNIKVQTLTGAIFWRFQYRLVFGRMASFGWKRKIGEKVSKAAAQQFEAESEKVDDHEPESVDWMHAIKRRREVLLEDCAAKSKRLKDEGGLLAEEGRCVCMFFYNAFLCTGYS